MAKPRLVPFRPTPSVVGTGSLSKPSGNGPKPSFQAPLLSTPGQVAPNRTAGYQKGKNPQKGK